MSPEVISGETRPGQAPVNTQVGASSAVTVLSLPLFVIILYQSWSQPCPLLLRSGRKQQSIGQLEQSEANSESASEAQGCQASHSRQGRARRPCLMPRAPARSVRPARTNFTAKARTLRAVKNDFVEANAKLEEVRSSVQFKVFGVFQRKNSTIDSIGPNYNTH